MPEWMVDGTLLFSLSGAIAIAWVIGNPLIIVWGHYKRDRSRDETHFIICKLYRDHHRKRSLAMRVQRRLRARAWQGHHRPT